MHAPIPLCDIPSGCCFFRALDSHHFFPSRAASGRCILTAAAACVPCGVVCALAEPSSWHTGGCASCCRGHFTVCATHSPLHPGLPPHASPHFRVREAQLPHPSACCPGRPPPASPHRHVCEAQLLHLCACRTWAFRVSEGVVRTCMGGACSLARTTVNFPQLPNQHLLVF